MTVNEEAHVAIQRILGELLSKGISYPRSRRDASTLLFHSSKPSTSHQYASPLLHNGRSGMPLLQEERLRTLPYHKPEFPSNSMGPFHGPIDDGAASLLPKGSISHIRLASYGSVQYFCQSPSKTLWLLWPPTDANLAWFSLHVTLIPNLRFTLRAIQGLEGMQLFYQDHTSERSQSSTKEAEVRVWATAPGCLYACLQLNDAQCCASIPMWVPSLLEDSLRALDWGVRWLLMHARDFLPAVVEEPRKFIESELDGWTKAVGELGMEIEERVKDDIERKVQDAREFLKVITRQVATLYPPLGTCAT